MRKNEQLDADPNGKIDHDMFLCFFFFAMRRIMAELFYTS
jgi:hypothetical protein